MSLKQERLETLERLRTLLVKVERVSEQLKDKSDVVRESDDFLGEQIRELAEEIEGLVTHAVRVQSDLHLRTGGE